MDHLRLPDPHIVLDGRELGCRTDLAYLGAYQLTIWTLVSELHLELHSTYLGHPAAETAVSHLVLQASEGPSTTTELRPGRVMPVSEGRRLCLYDHLATLRQVLADATNGEVAVDIPDEALALVDLS